MSNPYLQYSLAQLAEADKRIKMELMVTRINFFCLNRLRSEITHKLFARPGGRFPPPTKAEAALLNEDLKATTGRITEAGKHMEYLAVAQAQLAYAQPMAELPAKRDLETATTQMEALTL